MLTKIFQSNFYNSQDLSEGFFRKNRSQEKPHHPQKFPKSWDESKVWQPCPHSCYFFRQCTAYESILFKAIYLRCQTIFFLMWAAMVPLPHIAQPLLAGLFWMTVQLASFSSCLFLKKYFSDVEATATSH